MANKYLLSGGLIREFRFTSSGSFKSYLLSLEAKKQSYHVLQSFFYDDDSVYARIITCYSGRPLTERGIVQDSQPMPEKTDCFLCALAYRCMHGYELLYGMRPSVEAIGQCPDFIPADLEVPADA